MTEITPHNSNGHALVPQALAALCDMLPQGVWLLDAQGRVIWANQRARQGNNGVRLDKMQRLCTHRAYDTRRLHDAIRCVLQGGAGHTLCVARAQTPAALLVSVLVLPGGQVAVCALAPEEMPSLPPETLHELYDLTPSEARFATLLAQGQSVEEVARALHIQPGTARTHLKRIFNKTNTHRQGELVRLLLLGAGWFTLGEQ